MTINKLLFILFFLSLVSCQSKSVLLLDVAADKDYLTRHVRTLTDTSSPRSYDNPHILNETADYISGEFKRNSERVVAQTYIADGVEYKNIICSFGPETGERVIVGAHYDVFGDQSGADDNASGIAGLLEISRLLRGRASTLKYRVDLVAYTLEEQPFFKTTLMGSAVHAKSLADEGVPVQLMVCLEMIGYYSDDPESQSFPISLLKWFYPDTGNFILIASNLSTHFKAASFRKQMQVQTKIDVQQITSPSFVTGIDFSDHYNYWKEGYPALMVTDTAFYRNGHYHMKSDTMETLDFDKMSDVVTGIFSAIINLK